MFPNFTCPKIKLKEIKINRVSPHKQCLESPLCWVSCFWNSCSLRALFHFQNITMAVELSLWSIRKTQDYRWPGQDCSVDKSASCANLFTWADSQKHEVGGDWLSLTFTYVSWRAQRCMHTYHMYHGMHRDACTHIMCLHTPTNTHTQISKRICSLRTLKKELFQSEL